MTAVLDRPATVTPVRLAGAALALTGPAAIALLRLLMPYDTADTLAAIAAKVVADHGDKSLLLWLGFVGVLTLVPGLVLVVRPLWFGARRLTTVSLLLLVPAYLSLGWVTAADLLLWTGAREGLDVATITRLYQATHPTADVAIALFVAGHVLGTVLLGIAMFRSGAVPRWAAVLTVVSQPVHFIAAVIITSHPLDFAAWTMNAIGFAASALALPKTPGPAH